MPLCPIIRSVYVNSLILQKLTGIDDKLVSLESRVQRTETVLADRTTHPVPSTVLPNSNSQNNSSTASNVASDTVVSVSDTGIVPS